MHTAGSSACKISISIQRNIDRENTIVFLSAITIFDESNMELMQSMKKIFALLGMNSSKRRFTGAVLIILSSFVILISCYVLFLVKIAKTFKEVTDVIYLLASTTLITLGFIVLVVKKNAIFKLIDCLDEFIDASKIDGTDFKLNQSDKYTFIHI